MKKIVVLSGGGAKGMIQSECLNQLEQRGELKDIDLYLGTSVGSINASILASGVCSARDLSGLYKDMAYKVFRKRSKFFNKLRPPIYDRQNFINCFNNIVGQDFLISQVRTPLIVTSVDMTNKKVVFFKSYKDKYKYNKLLDVVCKSFAAPYYFGEIDDDRNEVKYADGGMGVDNLPISEAILEMFKNGWQCDQVQFIIVGCGYSQVPEDYKSNKGASTAHQLSEYMDPLDGGLAREMSRNWQLGYLQLLCGFMPNVHMKYYDCLLPEEMDRMDKLEYLDLYHDKGNVMSRSPLINI